MATRSAGRDRDSAVGRSGQAETSVESQAPVRISGTPSESWDARGWGGAATTEISPATARQTVAPARGRRRRQPMALPLIRAGSSPGGSNAVQTAVPRVGTASFGAVRRSSSDGAPRGALRAELEGLRMKALRERAEADGVSPELIEDAEDGEAPKIRLVELVLAIAKLDPPGPGLECEPALVQEEANEQVAQKVQEEQEERKEEQKQEQEQKDQERPEYKGQPEQQLEQEREEPREQRQQESSSSAGSGFDSPAESEGVAEFLGLERAAVAWAAAGRPLRSPSPLILIEFERAAVAIQAAVRGSSARRGQRAAVTAAAAAQEAAAAAAAMAAAALILAVKKEEEAQKELEELEEQVQMQEQPEAQQEQVAWDGQEVEVGTSEASAFSKASKLASSAGLHPRLECVPKLVLRDGIGDKGGSCVTPRGGREHSGLMTPDRGGGLAVGQEQRRAVQFVREFYRRRQPEPTQPGFAGCDGWTEPEWLVKADRVVASFEKRAAAIGAGLLPLLAQTFGHRYGGAFESFGPPGFAGSSSSSESEDMLVGDDDGGTDRAELEVSSATPPPPPPICSCDDCWMAASISLTHPRLCTSQYGRLVRDFSLAKIRQARAAGRGGGLDVLGVLGVEMADFPDKQPEGEALGSAAGLNGRINKGRRGFNVSGWKARTEERRLALEQKREGREAAARAELELQLEQGSPDALDRRYPRSKQWQAVRSKLVPGAGGRAGMAGSGDNGGSRPTAQPAHIAGDRRSLEGGGREPGQSSAPTQGGAGRGGSSSAGPVQAKPPRRRGQAGRQRRRPSAQAAAAVDELAVGAMTKQQEKEEEEPTEAETSRADRVDHGSGQASVPIQRAAAHPNRALDVRGWLESIGCDEPWALENFAAGGLLPPVGDTPTEATAADGWRVLADRMQDPRPGVAAYYFALIQRDVAAGGLGLGVQMGPLLRLCSGLRQL